MDEAGLVSAALAEIGGGAAWVKVIADFPDLAAGTDAEATYQLWSSCSPSAGHACRESAGIKVDAHGQRIGARRR